MTDDSRLQVPLNSPYSQEAEEAVIGSILVNPNAYLALAAFLEADDFYLLRHQFIWQAIARLNERNEALDYLTIVTELKNMGWLEDIGGPAYLTRLINNTPSAIHAEFYGRIVERAAVRRRLLKAADEIKSIAVDEQLDIDRVVNEAEMRLFNVTDRQVKREFKPMYEAVSQYFDQIEYLMQNRDKSFGVPTGFKDLDQLLGGFQRSDLVIFAGRPGMGKCVAAGTRIPTERGLLPIESLQPRDAVGIPDDEGGVYYPLRVGVMTPTGRQQTAYFYDSGLQSTRRLTTKAGYTLTATYPHPVLILTPNGQKVWKPMADLRVGDYVAVQRHNSTRLEWDSITALEGAGIQHCYDLTVPEGQAFVANGIVSHNTSFLLSAAANAARMGARVAIFSMEMGADQIVQRLISMETGINMQKLRLAQLTPQEYMRFVEAAGRVSRMPMFIDDTPALSPLQMRTKCRRLEHEQGLDLIMVDYLQLMNAGGQYQNNRVQEISYISRALKELARELNVPLVSAAQLSRAVEQRQDKRPVLSDLRESGCIAGDELVYLPDEGRHVPIRDLSGQSGFRVLSLNERTWKLEPAQVTNAFCTGVKPVYRMTTRLGRTIRATSNHKFLTICGWKRLDELTTADHIALPRTLPTPDTQTMTNSELALLGHLIGDGCTLPSHAVQYTTREIDLAETVVQLARDVFGDAITPRIHQEKGHSWYQVFLAATERLTHGKYSPVRVWLESLGVWGLRSHEKRIPDKVFQQPRAAIALFLRHLWATDGSINVKPVTNGHYPTIYYASSSYVLAKGVQTLLLTLGINARMKAVSQGTKGRTQYHVILGGKTELQNFAETIGAVGEYKSNSLRLIKEKLDSSKENTNRDVIPHHVWTLYAKPAMAIASITGREMYSRLNTAYAGTAIYKQNVSRERAAKLAHAVESEQIRNLSCSDIYWDEIVSIEPDGETDVYDLTVDDHHNFSCCNIICHNSIEQDSDVVMFLYRDVIYNEATEYPNQADVIVGKHRNGPTGSVQLFYDGKLTKFMDGAVRRIDLGDV